jgi:hypothetical protein
MKLLLTVLVYLVLTGCAKEVQVEKPVEVVKVERVPITIPAELLVKCNISRPPEVKKYANANCRDKEDQLFHYTVSLLNDLNKCNAQIGNIKSYNDSLLKK